MGDDCRSSSRVCETRSWLPASLRRPCWPRFWLTCQVPMSPSECTHSSGTGGWCQCHSRFLSSSTTKSESTYSDQASQAIGSSEKPTTKRRTQKIEKNSRDFYFLLLLSLSNTYTHSHTRYLFLALFK